MGIRIEWLDDAQTIIIFQIEGNWTASDLPELAERLNQMLESVDHRVDIIGVFTDAQIPSGNLLLSTRGTLRGTHPRRGLLVFVDLKPFLRAVLNILQTVYPNRLERLRMVSTLDEAREMIHRSREMDEVQC